jgi:uncharacterized membrane protein
MYILLSILSVIGIAETAYLIKKRINLEKPMCPINDDCSLVLNNKYNKFLFIHNDVMGLLFYITTLFMSLLFIFNIGPISLLFKIIAIIITAGAIVSLFFTYLQWRVIRSWCFWCLMSATTIWLMGIIILFKF